MPHREIDGTPSVLAWLACREPAIAPAGERVHNRLERGTGEGQIDANKLFVGNPCPGATCWPAAPGWPVQRR